MSLIKSAWKRIERDIRSQPMTLDPRSRLFFQNTLVLILTTRCNFRCQHCFRNMDQPLDLSLDIAERMAREAKRYNFHFSALTGGEPFLYPQLQALLDFLAQEDLGFSINTNGYHFEEWLPRLLKYKKYLRRVTFSMDSSDQKHHDALRQQGAFGKILKDFDLCRSHKIPFTVITTLSRSNADELFDIALLAKKKGAMALAVTTALACPRTDEHRFVLPAHKRVELLRLIPAVSRVLKFPVMTHTSLFCDHNATLCSPLAMTEVAIDPAGNLVPCCELGNFDDPHIRKNTVITQVKDKTFGETLEHLARYVNRVCQERIKDYQDRDVTDIDFHSCFYCLGKIKNNP